MRGSREGPDYKGLLYTKVVNFSLSIFKKIIVSRLSRRQICLNTWKKNVSWFGTGESDKIVQDTRYYYDKMQ